MPNSSTRSGSQPKKSGGSSAAKATAKNPPTKNAPKGGTRTSPGKKTAASTRFAERQARKQEEARRARQNRNKRYAFVTIGLVIALVAVLVIVKVAGGGGGSSSSADQPSPPRGTPIPAATLAHLSSVPISTLNSAPSDAVINAPQPVNQKALTADGKPELLYIGAEFCPHCAGERWPMYIALSKFGTFSPEPGKIHSATQDGNVPTLTFYGTNYTSPYLTFTPVEVQTNYLNSSGTAYATLQTPTPAQYNLWQEGNGGTTPYANFGGKAILSGSQIDFTPMEDMSFDAVAAQVGDNSTTIGASINAAASQLIKTICSTMTHDQPSAVCSP